MMSQNNSLELHFKHWKFNNCTEADIAKELSEKNYEASLIEETIKAYKKKYADRRQNNGFIITAIGSFLCFLSCVFTMLNLFPSLVGFFLYGLTTIGIVLVMYGLYFIFEA